MFIKLLAVVLSVATVFSLLSVNAAAEASSQEVIIENKELSRLPFYSEVKSQYPQNLVSENFELDINTARFDGNSAEFKSDIFGKDSTVLVWKEGTEGVSFDFECKTDGIYTIVLEYCTLSESGNNAVRNLLIDGEAPFFEASNLVFYSLWKDEGEKTLNSLSDEVRPDTNIYNTWQTIKLYDGSGIYAMPLTFYFTAGKHTLGFQYVSNDMAIARVAFEAEENIKSYSEVSKGYEKDKGKNYLKAFQAETLMTLKNDSTLLMTSASDPEMEPKPNGFRIYNMVGNETWQKGNQTISFEIEVPEDGLYKIGMRYRQKWNDGLSSYRRIEIDGSTPFSELLCYEFKYSTSWETEVLGDENGAFLFELSKGKHTITMSVVLEAYAEVIHKLYDITTLLSDISLDITMLTGSNPDPNYDYKFYTYIPTLEDDLDLLINSLDQCSKSILKIVKKSSSISSSLVSTAEEFKAMREDPYIIAKRFGQFSSAQTTLGTWYSTLQLLPLGIDEFYVASPDSEIPNRQSTVFQNIVGALRAFIITFSRDYDSMASNLDGDVKIKDRIEVWVGQGMEWAEILKELADKDFTNKTGIIADISIVPSGQLNSGSANVLLLSIISGTAPDVALTVASSSPVEFAIRDAAVPLNKFADFNEVKKRFLEETFVPVTYQSNVYAIPETMSFSAVFYRTDIFEKYNYKVPKTWDELCNDTLQLLSQNGMQFYLPSNFNYFLFQNGGSYYTEDGYYSALDSKTAFAAYNQFTAMFTENGCPVTASFFNRFRSGEMPIGIGDFGLYLQLKTAAPELAGKWEMADLIGTEQEDGSINISAGGVLTGVDMMIAKDNESKYDSCWEFLKWWSSDNTQTQYARRVEAVLGTESRWCSANVNAFMSLDWGRNDREVIKKQWNWVVETPTVLGSAYASRYLKNAFTDVVVSGISLPRDALEKAVKEINRELKLKQEEYGVFADE